MNTLYNWWKSAVVFLWKGKSVILFRTVDYFSLVLGSFIFVCTLLAIYIVKVIAVHSHLQQCYDSTKDSFFFLSEKGTSHQSCSRLKLFQAASKQAHKAHRYTEGNRYGSCTKSSFIAELKNAGINLVR